MNLVIVSNGSWKMIKSYRKLLGNKCPYPIYTDRAKHIYTALGMTLRTWDAGKEKDRGGYIQNSLGASVIAGIKSGVKLPIKPPGDQQLLGGEFIFGPGIDGDISFCHRMKTTRGHAEIEDVLASVGINLEEENKMLRLVDSRSMTSTPTTPHLSNINNTRTTANGLSNLPHSSSLAASIMHRLHHGSPRISTTSPPGSPTMTSSGGIGSGEGLSSSISSNSINGGVGRTRSKRLQKKNRNSKSDMRSSVISQSPLGISNTTPRSPTITEREDEQSDERRRPISNSTSVPEMTHYRYSSPPPSSSFSALNTHRINDKMVREEDNVIKDEEERNQQQENDADDRSRKHSSAPPHLPTPTSITPLSMGFLQAPGVTPPLMSGNAVNNKDQRYSTTIDEIYDGYLTTRPNYTNGIHKEGYDDVVENFGSSDLQQSSSRFSESSGDEEDNKKKKDSNIRKSRHSSSLNRPRSFVKGLSLRSSNSSLNKQQS